MVKSIFKRIIVGVGVALALMLIKGSLLTKVYAREMSTSSFGGLQVAVNGTDNNYIWDVTDGSWENWGSGVLIGNGSIIKTNGQSTSSFATVRSVMAYSGNQAYVCRMGSTASNNSTYQNQTFTFECPMIMGTYGLQQIAFIYSHTGGTDFTMRLEVNGSMTFIKDDDTSGSSTTSAINNQITNDNTNTTNIINNNNQNTQQQIESQKVCFNKIYYYKDTVSSGYLSSSTPGTISANDLWGVTDFIPYGSNTTITITNLTGTSASLCFYNSSRSVISCSRYDSLSNGNLSSIPSNTSYFRLSIRNNDVPQFTVFTCQNGNQAIADGQQQTNQNLQDINNSINDDSSVSDSDIEDLFGDLEDSNTPISDLLTMPLTLIQAYITGMSGTCQSINLGNLYGSNLIIPCIDLEDYLGSNLWGLIDVLVSMYIIYHFSKLLITAFDSLTSLKDNFEWLYGVEGKHVGVPSRVERNSDLY